MARISLHSFASSVGLNHTVNLYHVVSLETLANDLAIVHLVDGQKIMIKKEAADHFNYIWEHEEDPQNGQ